MKIEKPITQNLREKARLILDFLHDKKDYITKAEIMAVAGVKNERSAREIISYIAGYCPIIATSDNKGYKLAKTTADLEAVEHAWKELDSRQAELERRKQPLIKFYEKAKELGQNG